MHELSRRSARNYAPTRDVSVSRRCCMRDLLLHGHYKLVALGVIGKKTREQPNCGSPMPTSDSAGLSTALDCPRHAMLAQRRRSWQRGRQLVCRRGDRMAASTLGSRASHTPSARIARSPRARRRCRHFIVDADQHQKARWRRVAPRAPGLARRRPCPRGRAGCRNFLVRLVAVRLRLEPAAPNRNAPNRSG